MSEGPVKAVDVSVVVAARDADPEEQRIGVPSSSPKPSRMHQKQQREETEDVSVEGDVREDTVLQGSEQAPAVDLTQSPRPLQLDPIVVDDTPVRPARADREYVDLTATTPRPSTGLRRITTVERDFELARKLQEEEERPVQGSSQASSSSSAGPVDDDLALARRLQEEADAEMARQLLQSARERTSPPAISAAYIHGLIEAHQGRRRHHYDEDEDDSDYDGYGWDAADGDELEAMHRLPFAHAPAVARGRYQPPVRIGGRAGRGQQLPRDPQLRELMMRDIDPNDYETLLQLDEQKTSKRAEKQVEQLIKNLPRYEWPDMTAALTGKSKKRATDRSARAGKRRRGDEPLTPSKEEESDISAQTSKGKRRRKSRSLPTEDEVVEADTTAAPAISSSSSSLTSPHSSTTTATSDQRESITPAAEPCPICLEHFSDGQVVCVTPCESLHTFHETCIKHWLRVKPECPIDKTQLA